MLPSNSPFILQTLICTTCGAQMRCEIQKMNSGKPTGFTYYCDTPRCLYSFKSAAYANGETLAKHDSKQEQKPLYPYGTPEISPAADAPMLRKDPPGGAAPASAPAAVPPALVPGTTDQPAPPVATATSDATPTASEAGGLQGAQ